MKRGKKRFRLFVNKTTFDYRLLGKFSVPIPWTTTARYENLNHPVAPSTVGSSRIDMKA